MLKPENNVLKKQMAHAAFLPVCISEARLPEYPHKKERDLILLKNMLFLREKFAFTSWLMAF